MHGEKLYRVEFLKEEYHSGYPQTLLCPRCGHEYLHHQTTSTFERGEDAEKVMLTRVDHLKTETSLVPNTNENPSSRRNGLTITFYCENCGPHDWDGIQPNQIGGPLMELCIEQHKGCTYVYWRFPEGR